MSTPILVAPCDGGQYVLDTDASDTALGAVLQQEQGGKLHVIGYASRTLSPSEARYCITRRELLGVVFGLTKFRQYLLVPKIIVRRDHAALTYHKSMPEPIGQQGRWLDFLGEYDITIHHRPGRAHGNSDALSRRPCERSNLTRCQQCTKATPSLAADPVVCEALPFDSSSELPAPIRFKPLYSHADSSSDLSMAQEIPDLVSDQMEVPVLPVSREEATHALLPNDVTAGAQVLGITAEPASITPRHGAAILVYGRAGSAHSSRFRLTPDVLHISGAPTHRGAFAVGSHGPPRPGPLHPTPDVS